MIKLTLVEFMQIGNMLLDATELFEKHEKKEVNPALCEVVIYDLDFKSERKIDIGLV